MHKGALPQGSEGPCPQPPQLLCLAALIPEVQGRGASPARGVQDRVRAPEEAAGHGAAAGAAEAAGTASSRGKDSLAFPSWPGAAVPRA